MHKSVQVLPDHWLIFIGDEDGDIPDEMQPEPSYVSATDSCVAVSTVYNELTTITLTDEDSGEPENHGSVFDGILATPSRKLVVSDAADTTLLEMELSSAKTNVRIFTNHLSEPDSVFIVVNPSW